MESLVLLWAAFGIFCAYYHYLYFGHRCPVYVSQILHSVLLLLYGLLNDDHDSLVSFLPAFAFYSIAVAAGPGLKTTLLAGSAFLVLLSFLIDDRGWHIVLATGALIQCIAAFTNLKS